MNKDFFTFVPDMTMKNTSCILLFYVLVLIALPCFDVSGHEHIIHTEISQNPHNHDHNGVDLCSPFCACSCCVSHLISPAYIIQIDTILLSQDYNSGYSASYISSLFASIWQPPKIS
jgi:hypothetical protein